MMNRNSEWEAFVCEMKSGLPPQVEYSAQRAILRAKHQRGLLLKLPIAGVFMAFVLLVTLKNTGPVQAMVNIPRTGLARLLSGATLRAAGGPELRG